MNRFYSQNPILLGLGLALLSSCAGELAALGEAGEADVVIELDMESVEPEVLALLPEEDMKFYWYEGQKIPLSQSTTHRAVRYSAKATPQHRQNVAAALNVEEGIAELDLGNGIFLYPVEERPLAPAAPFQVLEALSANASELAVFEAPSGGAAILTEEFNVQFKAEVTKQQIDEWNAKNKVSIVSASTWEANAFVLAVQEDAGVDALTMANRYYESGLTTYASPNFVQLIERTFVPNDPLFPQQWALNNTAQGGRGIAGKDIRAVTAWDRTRGSSSITIAIIDEGVDYAHPDLNTSGKLVTGYDALLKRDNPNPVATRDDHGTACAGIAAAAGNNGLGVSGVAPGSRIMGIRIAQGTANGGWSTTDSALADGIATAANRGADVLSNSWGGGAPSSVITNAIRHAKTNGRGGKGAVVVFATGNNSGSVSYPANLPEVFSVGACNQWGEYKSRTSRDGEPWGSNFGPQVDVCAPGVSVYTTTNGGGYINNFNGTSAATPHVAGVAALVLSLNPNLTAAQVEQILRNATDVVGSAGRDDYTGHGFINAFKAVQAVGSTPNPNPPRCTLNLPVSSISQAGGTYHFSASCTDSPSSYVWTVNGQQVGSSSSLSYTFAANNTASARSFTVAMSASNSAGSSSPVQTTLNQPGLNNIPVCSFGASTASIPASGGTYSIAVSCTHSPMSYEWTINGQRQAGTGSTIVYTFPANNTASERTFEIVVSATNSTGKSNPARMTVRQAASTAVTPVCNFSAPTASIPASGGTYSIAVRCTLSPTSHTWTINGQRQSGTGSTIVYTFPANNTPSARTFTVLVSARNNAGTGNTAQLTVHQPGR